MKFQAVIKIIGVNPYVLITQKQAAEIHANWKKPMPVLVQINGQPEVPWRINMMPIGDGSFYLYLHGDVRKASGTKVGDTVTVDVQFDQDYKNGPQHPMPNWLAEALEKYPSAQKHWDALSPSRQKEVLRYFANLKSVEAQKRNLTRAIDVLSGKGGHFMGRDWCDGK